MKIKSVVFLIVICLLFTACGTQDSVPAMQDSTHAKLNDRVDLHATTTEAATEEDAALPVDATAKEQEDTTQKNLTPVENDDDSWNRPHTEPEEEITEPYVFDEAAAKAICEKYTAVAAQVAIVKDGKVAGVYQFGQANAQENIAVTQDTKYRVASLTKLVTAIVCMRLVEEGKLNLDEDISKYYGFNIRNPQYPDVPITLRMLLTHTASMYDGAVFNTAIVSSSVSAQALLQSATTFTSAKPGSVHNYSNIDYAVVGSVCETVCGKNLEEIAREYIFDPMGLTCSYHAAGVKDASQVGILYDGDTTVIHYPNATFLKTVGQTMFIAQGNLIASASDYAKILCMLINGGEAADGTRILTEESVNAICSTQYEAIAYKVGFGCFVQNNVIGERTMYVHTGSAYGMYAAYAVDLQNKDAVVVLTTGASGSKDATTEIYNVDLELIRLLFPTE